MVDRRYTDFYALHNHLLQKYANRIVPRPPPKQLMIDSFIEERRTGLQRWLRLLSQHPLISSDELLKTFLTVSTPDQLQQMQNVFNSDPDEFSRFSELKLPHCDLDQLVISRETMRTRLNQVVRLKRFMEQQAKREMNQSRDFQELSSTISAISNEKNFSNFSENFLEISKESEKVSIDQQLAVTERLVMIIEILTAHSDLCDRVEKNLSTDSTAKNLGENYENEVKRRKNIALFCVAEETKFVEKYLKLLPSILLQFSFEESKGFCKIFECFKKAIEVESDEINCENGK